MLTRMPLLGMMHPKPVVWVFENGKIRPQMHEEGQMISRNKYQRSTGTQRTLARTSLALLVTGVLLIPATVCLAIISKVNVRNTGDSTTANINIDSSEGLSNVSGIPVCPPVVASLVVKNGETAELVNVMQDGLPVESSTSVNPAHQDLLAFKLQKTAAFIPTSQDTVSFKLFPVNCMGSTNIEIEYKVFDAFGDIVLPRALTAGGTTESDLADGLPLSQFAFIRSVRVVGLPVPAVSTWGLVVLVLLLLVGAKTYFGRRRSMPSM
jgi:hypothetical protein